ncbi:hypothetical protein [Bacillus subtilis]|uniref:hypothetical protein n=1 Tax=Bacillus subtilis TaxID=1423 RepID=UPI001B9B5B68|nr:hypothetical protein [Bacillus subtilis]CAI6330964.1 hypothetical protein NRS6096_22265 [Bacillus subtilis]
MNDCELFELNPEPENEYEQFYKEQYQFFREYPLTNKEDSSVKRAMRIVYELESYAEFGQYELFEDIFIEQAPFSLLYSSFKKNYEKAFNEPFEELEEMFLEPLQLKLIGEFVSGVLKVAKAEFDSKE